MIGPEDLEDSPPPAEEVEEEKEEDIGEVVEIGEVKEVVEVKVVEEVKEVAEVEETEVVVTEVEAKGDTEEESKKVEEVVQVVTICSFLSVNLFLPRWNSLLLKLRSSLLRLLRMTTLHLTSSSLPLHLPPLQLSLNLCQHLPLCLLHLNLQQPHLDHLWLLPGLKLPLPGLQPPWKRKYATHSKNFGWTINLKAFLV